MSVVALSGAGGSTPLLSPLTTRCPFFDEDFFRDNKETCIVTSETIDALPQPLRNAFYEEVYLANGSPETTDPEWGKNHFLEHEGHCRAAFYNTVVKPLKRILPDNMEDYEKLCKKNHADNYPHHPQEAGAENLFSNLDWLATELSFCVVSDEKEAGSIFPPTETSELQKVLLEHTPRGLFSTQENTIQLPPTISQKDFEQYLRLCSDSTDYEPLPFDRLEDLVPLIECCHFFLDRTALEKLIESLDSNHSCFRDDYEGAKTTILALSESFGPEIAAPFLLMLSFAHIESRSAFTRSIAFELMDFPEEIRFAVRNISVSATHVKDHQLEACADIFPKVEILDVSGCFSIRSIPRIWDKTLKVLETRGSCVQNMVKSDSLRQLNGRIISSASAADLKGASKAAFSEGLAALAPPYKPRYYSSL